MDYSQLFSTMIVFIVLMCIGYIGVRKKMLSPEFAKNASKLVLNVFLPATVLNAAGNSDVPFSGSQLLNLLLLFTLVLVLCYGLSALAIALCFKKSDQAPIIELLMSVPNPMFVGLPIAQAIYGSASVIYFALFCIPYHLSIYSYGIWRLKAGKGRKDKGIQWRELISMPTLASLLSLLILIVRLPLPGILQKLCANLSGATMPMSMLVIGATLGSVSLLDAFKAPRNYLICFVRLLLAPLLVWFVLRFLPISPLLHAVCLILAACPSAIMISVLSLQYDYDPVLSSQGVMLTTVLSMFTIPLLIRLLV